MRREAAVSKLCLAAAAVALLASGAMICGCGGDDDGPLGPTGSITVSVDGGPDVTMGGPSGYGSLGAYYISGSPPVPPLSTAVLAGSFGSAPMAIITFDGDLAGTFDVGAGETAVGYTASTDTMYGAIGGGVGSGTVTVDVYGLVGERIEGTFDVTAHLWDPATGNPTATTVNLTGSFSVVRLADDYTF